MSRWKRTVIAGAACTMTWTAALESNAQELGKAVENVIVRSTDLNDTARINRAKRLRKTDEEFTNEQDTIACLAPNADGSVGCLECGMRTGALEDGTEPVHNMQCACTPLTVAPNGTMSVAGPSRFVTDNDGNEYRNCNKPTLMAINGAQRYAFMFNYQPDNTSDTRRYMKVFDAAGAPLALTNANGEARKQVQIMHKDNDDCDMHQDGNGPGDIARSAGGVDHLALWAGCNGNGEDDGWMNFVKVDCSAGTACQVSKVFDISLAQHEERSRGTCQVSDNDPTFATCTWTEGNNQPQEDGVWIAGVDISEGGETGEDAASRLLWKEEIERRVEVDGRRMYAQRMVAAPILSADGRSNGDLLLSYTRHRGGNRNNEKGGTNYRTMTMVVNVTRQGFTPVMDKTDITELMLGVDVTHGTFSPALFGSAGNLVPGAQFLLCSHNGGLASSGQVKSLGYNAATKQMIDLGTASLGTGCDRHLYSNYLGNNPGNQGRNFQGSTMIPNPAAKLDATKPAFSIMYALSGKTAGNPATEGMQFKPDQKVSKVELAYAPVIDTARAGLAASEGSSSGCSATGGSSSAADLVLLFGCLVLIGAVRRRRD